MIESIQYISLTQALIAGIILFFFKKNQQYHFRYLSLFLLLLFLGILNESYTSYLGNEYHLLTAFNFQLLLPNLIYLHVCRNMSLSLNKKSVFLHFVPGIIEFVCLAIEGIVVSCNLIEVDSICLDYFYDIYTIVEVVYIVFIQIQIFKTISNYNKQIYEFFSTVNYRYLNWLKWVCIIIIINEVYYCSYYFSPVDSLAEDPYYLVYSILELIVIYYVSIHALVQVNINTKIDVLEVDNITKEGNEYLLNQKYEEDFEGFKKVFGDIEEYLKRNKSYLNPDLNLKTLAILMGVSQKDISKGINAFSGTNFHGYINQYRVSEAKIMLQNEEYEKYSMSGIGEESGFNSKSSFYNNFKKEVGLSPKEFRDQFY